MTIERAIEILNPEHREHYDSIETVNEACRMGMEALQQTRWVPVSEENPPERTFVVCSDGHVVFMNMFVGNDWLTGGWIRGIKPTHWMLLPEPPGGGMTTNT